MAHTLVLTHYGRPLPTSLWLHDRLVRNGKHKFTIWFFCLEDRAGEKERGSCFVTFSSHLINDLEVAARGGNVSYVGMASVWKQPSVGDSLGRHVQALSGACGRHVLHFSLGTRKKELQNAQVANSTSQY